MPFHSFRHISLPRHFIDFPRLRRRFLHFDFRRHYFHFHFLLFFHHFIFFDISLFLHRLHTPFQRSRHFLHFLPPLIFLHFISFLSFITPSSRLYYAIIRFTPLARFRCHYYYFTPFHFITPLRHFDVFAAIFSLL